ncbi:MAG: UDP-N-acetylmuramoyl-L-alanyl-D-glutamate--2,6-diaminopimelate ligase [Burkholderiaceae bacterium]|jgi:UDP-N-acetylmuramoyl-L-alanyl-D-glutamate--2,6-diaminopimelate ligase|nr:UDP-N-acetylmuramoyl-L-alanyl-D-glutamate--2,6-diaminopimelate ligase [Burkholderiaceae bacterium]
MPTPVPAHLPHAAAAAQWLAARGVARLRTDHRHVQPGDAFLAWPGYAHDARRFVGAALQSGALACLVDDHHLASFGFADVRIAAVSHLKDLVGPIAHLFLGRPSESLKVIATTGTNGKTSTAWWTAQALTSLGRRCALVGTLGIGEPRIDGLQSSGMTTPDPVRLQQALHDFVAEGFVACAIEASSIGLQERRLAGTHIEVALFTNLTQDHLDYHQDMSDYWKAKRALFAWPGLKAAVLNIDDVHGADLAGTLHHAPLDLWTCSTQGPARLQARGLHHDDDGGLAFELCEGETVLPLRSALIGDFNASNLLLVVAALRALGVALPDAARAAAGLGPVPGRMQRVRIESPGLPEVVVDYAHSPDALDKVLQALQPLARARGGRLWCVFGCGGNRDAAKRPMMGAIAARLADHVVLTSDNPRNEAPGFILSQILAGITGHDEVDVIEDRRAAIGHALAEAAPADVVLLAGKGHEATQEIAGTLREFSDLHEARAALCRRAGVAA